MNLSGRRFDLVVFLAILLLSVLVAGCSQSQRDVGPRLDTTPLTGVVQVDGEPATGVMVECHPVPGKSEVKSPLVALTNEDGEFSFGLYEKGGGIPAGTYQLVFKWELFENGMKDKLNGAYADPKDSKFPVTVEDGVSTDLGIIELSTK